MWCAGCRHPEVSSDFLQRIEALTAGAASPRPSRVSAPKLVRRLALDRGSGGADRFCSQQRDLPADRLTGAVAAVGDRGRPSPQPPRGKPGRHTLLGSAHREAVARCQARRVAAGAGHGARKVTRWSAGASRCSVSRRCRHWSIATTSTPSRLWQFRAAPSQWPRTTLHRADTTWCSGARTGSGLPPCPIWKPTSFRPSLATTRPRQAAPSPGK